MAMRLGKGKHLQGLTLMGGIVKPEEFDHFHEVSWLVLLVLYVHAFFDIVIRLAHYQL